MPFFYLIHNLLSWPKEFPTIFLLDCMYKTNKYKLPLLHIAGINSSNFSFSVGFCFLSSKTTEDYVWALEQFSVTLEVQNPSVLATNKEKALINALEEFFPDTTHILCSWHISKNIQTECHNFFDSNKGWESFTALWRQLVASQTTGEYSDNFNKLAKIWNTKTTNYLTANWLPIKEKKFAAYINRYPHFGNTFTS